MKISVCESKKQVVIEGDNYKVTIDTIQPNNTGPEEQEAWKYLADEITELMFNGGYEG